MARRRRHTSTGDPVARLAGAAVALVMALAAPAVAGPAQAAQQGSWWHDTWGMSQVWELSDGAGVTVAVVDSGVDASLPELAEAVVPGVNLLPDAGEDDTDDYDERGHGTAMASLIAGRGGDSGVVGVAPAAAVLPIVVGRGRRGQLAAAEEQAIAIRTAVDRGAQVISMSIGSNNPGPEPCPETVAAAVRYALSRDVVVVAASGNEPEGPTEFPGGCPGVLTVGAVGQRLEPWVDTHRSEHVDVVAPGTAVPVLRPGGQVDTGFGTSISTALVSGAVALGLAAYPEASGYEVVARILATVQDVGDPGRDDASGYGLVRPYEALTEPVPPGVANPVFDNAGDLTDTAEPSPEPTVFVPQEQPEFAAPPTTPDGGPVIGPVAVLAAIGGLVLLVVATVVTVLLVRSRRRAPPYPYPRP